MTTGTGTQFTDADDVWGNGATSSRQTAGVDAEYGAEKTFDYYKNVQGRNGIWDTGVGARSRVHYGNAYNNAFWDGTQMTYGDGAGNAKPLTSIDVAGHEMSHGVTENTAGLAYSGDAGGLNEATSDIFGTAVEFYAASAADAGDYLIGEKININGNGTPLRYMDHREGLVPHAVHEAHLTQRLQGRPRGCHLLRQGAVWRGLADVRRGQGRVRRHRRARRFAELLT